MDYLGFEPRASDDKRKQNHGAMAAASHHYC